MTEIGTILLASHVCGTFLAFLMMIFKVRNIYKKGGYLTWGRLLFEEILPVIFPIVNFVYILNRFEPILTEFLHTPAFKKKETDK